MGPVEEFLCMTRIYPNVSSFSCVMEIYFCLKDLRENNLDNIAPRFGSDLDGTIEKNPRHSTAMLRVCRLRPVQRWPEDWMRDCPNYFLSGPKYIKRLFVCREKNGQSLSKQHKMAEKNVFLKRGGRSQAHP